MRLDMSSELSEPALCSMSGGGTSNLQGGAIHAEDGAKVEINICTFTSNSADYVSPFLELFPGHSLTLPQSFFGPSSRFINGYIRLDRHDTCVIESR